MLRGLSRDRANARFSATRSCCTGPLKMSCATRFAIQKAAPRLRSNSRRRQKTETATAEIEVSDRGPGIPEDQLDAIFRPFYRVDYARSPNTGGFGVGLAIAERAVRLHTRRGACLCPGRRRCNHSNELSGYRKHPQPGSKNGCPQKSGFEHARRVTYTVSNPFAVACFLLDADSQEVW